MVVKKKAWRLNASVGLLHVFVVFVAFDEFIVVFSKCSHCCYSALKRYLAVDWIRYRTQHVHVVLIKLLFTLQSKLSVVALV